MSKIYQDNPDWFARIQEGTAHLYNVNHNYIDPMYFPLGIEDSYVVDDAWNYSIKELGIVWVSLHDGEFKLSPYLENQTKSVQDVSNTVFMHTDGFYRDTKENLLKSKEWIFWYPEAYLEDLLLSPVNYVTRTREEILEEL